MSTEPTDAKLSRAEKAACYVVMILAGYGLGCIIGAILNHFSK